MQGVEKVTSAEREADRPVRVLIVDDRRGTREGLSALLSQFGELVVVGQCANGREALRCVRELQPDVVLMDVVMPECDGVTATRHIRAASPATHVVILSLYPRYRARALRAGADAFLLKGCGPEELREVLLASVAATTA